MIVAVMKEIREIVDILRDRIEKNHIFEQMII